jgi:hypothetical protein
VTFSDCWITERDYGQPIEPLKMPPCPTGPYWIAALKEWARKNGLAIENVDHCVIQVELSRQLVQQFLDDHFPGDPASPATELRALVRKHLTDDGKCLLRADEF